MDESYGARLSSLGRYAEVADRESKVLFLFIADTVNSVFDMWWIYDVLVNHFSASHQSYNLDECDRSTERPTFLADVSALSSGNWGECTNDMRSTAWSDV